MRWFGTGETQIVGCSHQTDAEMMLPNAVDHNPGKQWIFRRGNPASKRGAASSGDSPCGFGIDHKRPIWGRQCGQCPGLNFLAGLRVDASLKKMMNRGRCIGFHKRRQFFLWLGALLFSLGNCFLHQQTQGPIFGKALD